MDTVSLSATKRHTETKPNAVRNGGQVPCVVYGNKVDNTLLQCTKNDVMRAYQKAGESTVVDLDIEGNVVPVLFHVVDLHAISGDIHHVDFYAVDMNKEIEAQVPVYLEGESPAVKEQGGVLLTVLDHVTVRCLPKHLPHNMTLDISPLAELNSSLHVSDLPTLEGVEIVQEPDTVLVTVQEKRVAEVEEAPAEEAGEEGAEAAAEGGGEEEKKEE